MTAHASNAISIATGIANEQWHATQRNERTNRRLTHLSDKASPSVTCVRVQPFAGIVGNRAGYAQRSEVTA